ncbi:bifunctional metallophosphatase/5'-nucleotidase [Bacillus testis]|uniref:bifunctional metallophosphatase/5'-nucleotidase n=1 Tax=Bacillus testis TaxID=1622072 RepID=UPI00067E86DF|nr:bifunctional UDP-sugar hydrolase/5'-nucleotidase [Bacillus testis]
MEETIHLYHINDLHSHFQHWLQIKNFISERKKLHREMDEESIIFDLGDHADRFHPYTEALLGKGNVKLLNELGCQYATIGNNEGITFPYDVLDHLYDEAAFEVIVANLYGKDGKRPRWAHPYSIHQTKKGNKVAIIGATANFKAFYEVLGWQITEPIEEIARAVEAVKEECDLIVLLSHLGLETDEQIAESLPAIDVILGAHTHHILHKGKMVGRTLLCGAGKGGTYVGHVEIGLYGQGSPELKTSLYDMNNQPPAEGTDDFLSGLEEVGQQGLSTVVCTLPEPIESAWFDPSPLAQLLADTLREWCQADCAILNAGLLLDGLEAGPVTMLDLHRICPHPINPCLVELTGQELKEIIIQSRDPEWPHMPVKGFGFRGSVMGNMAYSQISVPDRHHIYIAGKELMPKQMYKLAIPDMFTFGFFFPSIKRNNTKKYYLPEFLRDLLGFKLAELYPDS